jgi:hypothetical protein
MANLLRHGQLRRERKRRRQRDLRVDRKISLRG